jgi:hypothetical protein
MCTLIGRANGLSIALRTATGLSVISVILLCGLTAGAQSGDPSIRVLDVKKSAMQQEVGRLAQAGVAIVLAHLAPPGLFTAQTGMLLAQRDQEAGARSYLFVDDLEAFLEKGQLEAGYRLLPHTLTHGMKGRGLAGEFAGRYYCAIFEKLPMDNALRQYVFVKEPTAGDLEKKAHASGAGLVPVAIDTHGVAAGVFERQAQGGPWKILATTQKGTMERELSAAAAEGYRIVAASGGAERVFALVQSADAPPADYTLLEDKSASLERQMNEKAAEGFRFTEASLLSVGGSGSLGEATDLVMERAPTPAPIAYRVVGAARVGTMEKELLRAAADGFRILAATVGYGETVVVLAKPSGAPTATVR